MPDWVELSRPRQTETGHFETFDTGGRIANNPFPTTFASGKTKTMTALTTDTDIARLVETFWSLMGSNDFASVESVLGERFVLEWPQSNERIRGGARFAQMNTEYPAQGLWHFTVNRVVVSNNYEAVSDVSVTDGFLKARAISFFSVEGGKIAKIVEYWPEPYAAPAHRAHLVEPID